MNIIKYIQRLAILLLLLITTISSYSKTHISYGNIIKLYIDSVNINPEESYRKLSDILTQCSFENDSANIIKIRLALSDIDRFWGEYESAFEHLWEAMLYANNFNNPIYNVTINRNLGILYGIYNKDSKALEHLQYSLQLAKSLDTKDINYKNQTNACYFSLALHFKNLQQYNLSLKYLDSCILMNEENKEQPFVDAEKGCVFLKQGNFNIAQKYLFKSLNNIGKVDNRYHIVILSYIGDLKLAESNNDSALFYYLESLRFLIGQEAYVEIKPELLQKISTLYINKRETQKAYNYLLASKNASDSLFSSTNRRTNQLFEIKNKYQEALQEKEQFIAKQEVVIQRNSKIQLLLKVLSVFLILASISVYIFINQRTKIKKLALQQMLEKDKNKAILEVKNKELTAYALQLIEKDKSVNELLETIKQESPLKYKSLSNEHLKQKKNLWDEFNIRFIEVNSRFYERLRNKHPEISFTEQKHCALIKLNFDSNEMSKILNISLQSVHTSRYRIRKKIGLPHDKSLSDYIGKL